MGRRSYNLNRIQFPLHFYCYMLYSCYMRAVVFSCESKIHNFSSPFLPTFFASTRYENAHERTCKLFFFAILEETANYTCICVYERWTQGEAFSFGDAWNFKVNILVVIKKFQKFIIKFIRFLKVGESFIAGTTPSKNIHWALINSHSIKILEHINFYCTLYKIWRWTRTHVWGWSMKNVNWKLLIYLMDQP